MNIHDKISEELRKWKDVGWLMDELSFTTGWNFNGIPEEDVTMEDLEIIILDRLTSDEQQEILDFLIKWG